MNPLDSFGRTAQGLSRNPLGIIALFIVLVYGMAALVLSTVGASFKPEERAPIIWFLVLFPVLVLAVFGYLVMKFPRNLYSPSDYGNSGEFIRALTPSEQLVRTQEEVEEVLQQEAEEGEPVLKVEAQPLLESSLISGKKVKEFSANIRKNIRSEYLLSECLVLRELRAKYGTDLLPHAALIGSNRTVEFDAIIRTVNTLTGVEIKMMRTSKPDRIMLTRIADHVGISLLNSKELYPNLEFRYLLIIVTTLSFELAEQLKTYVASIVSPCYKGIDIEIYRLEELRRKYDVTPIN